MLLASVGFFPAHAQDDQQANALFVQAVLLYRQSEQKTAEAATAELAQVRALFDQILTEHPTSKVALAIESEGAPAGVDLSRLPVSQVVLDRGMDQYALPENVKKYIRRVAHVACGNRGECAAEIAVALSEYAWRVAFEGSHLGREERMRWLFSNPGQYGDDLARIDALDEALQYPDFRNEFTARINKRVLGNVASEVAADYAMGLIVAVTGEALASYYDSQGQTKAAAFTRRWFEPMVEIGLVLESAATGRAVPLGINAAIIWLKNGYALAHLGARQDFAVQTGTTPEAERERLSAEIDSYTRTLLTGRMTGIMFKGHEGKPISEQHAKVIQSIISDHYEMLRYWIRSDDIILMETFDWVLDGARQYFKTLSKLGQPQPLDSANGTGALPADLRSKELQPATDVFLPGAATAPARTEALGTPAAATQNASEIKALPRPRITGSCGNRAAQTAQTISTVVPGSIPAVDFGSRLPTSDLGGVIFAVPNLNIAPVASGDADLDAFLQAELPPYLVATEVEYKYFPGNDGGRLSVAGTLKLTEDLVGKPHAADIIKRTLVRDGIHPVIADGVISHIKPWGKQNYREYPVVVSAGTVVPFTAELSYIETVRARTFRGAVAYQLASNKPRSSLRRPDEFAVGDETFEVLRSALLRRSQSVQRQVRDIANAIQRDFLDPGSTIANRRNEAALFVSQPSLHEPIPSDDMALDLDANFRVLILNTTIYYETTGADVTIKDAACPGDGASPWQIGIQVPWEAVHITSGLASLRPVRDDGKAIGYHAGMSVPYDRQGGYFRSNHRYGPDWMLRPN